MPEMLNKALIRLFTDSVNIKPDYEVRDNKYDKKLVVYDNYINKINHSSVDYDKYPDQISSFLNKTVNIRLRIYNYANSKISNTVSSGRPADDRPFEVIPDRPDDLDFTFYEYKDMLILRFDKVEPYRVIAMTKDCKYLVIGSSTPNEEGYVFMSQVSIYPMQFDNLLNPGRTIYGYFKSEDNKYREAVVLAINEKDPFDAIIAEYIDDTVRFVLSDEVYFEYDNMPDQNYTDKKTVDFIARYRKQYLEDKILYNTTEIIDIIR